MLCASWKWFLSRKPGSVDTVQESEVFEVPVPGPVVMFLDPKTKISETWALLFQCYFNSPSG